MLQFLCLQKADAVELENSKNYPQNEELIKDSVLKYILELEVLLCQGG